MTKNFASDNKVRSLMEKGVKMPCPHAVEIGNDVDMSRISGQGVVFHSGTKIIGGRTLIGPGVILGYEAPLTAVDCRIGSGVELRGGFCRDSLLLDGVCIGSGAQIRENCILEEGVRAGHTVGLKQTILFPFVTLGSLINFCDCLMAGGTSRKNHSEVGSSFIHFNYTPRQDKATPSLIGDVPRGVMVNQPPIFLGGQGGIVGPVLIRYGAVVPAGTILRKDLPDGERPGGKPPATEKGGRHGSSGSIERKIKNNIVFVANLLSLRQWYQEIRSLFFEKKDFGEELQRGAAEIIESALDERLRRLREFTESPGKGSLLNRQMTPSLLRNYVNSRNEEKIALKERDGFIRIVEDRLKSEGPDYLRVIQGLSPKEASLGAAWLQAIVDDTVKRAEAGLPSPRGAKK